MRKRVPAQTKAVAGSSSACIRTCRGQPKRVKKLFPPSYDKELKMIDRRIEFSRVSSFVEILNIRARLQSDQLSYVFLSNGAEVDSLTFAQLRRKARALAARLQDMNAQDERVLLLYPAGLDYVV